MGYTMERCGVYFRNGSIYVETYSCDEFGIWVPDAKILNVERGSTRGIGKNVITALNASRKGIPHPKPDDMKQLEKKLNQFMGAKSWAELEKTSKYINLERDKLVTKIYPHRIGRGGGFEPYGPAISCSSTDPEEIGRGVLKALKLQENE